MINKLQRRLAGVMEVRDILGTGTALRFAMAKLSGAQSMQVQFDGFRVETGVERSYLHTIVESLGPEFTELGAHVDADFDGLIVDAGGFIGTAALKFNAMFPKATIVVIEPSRSNFEKLCRNTKHVANIHPRRMALSSVAGETVDLRDRGTGNFGFTILQTPDDNNSAEVFDSVETTSIDAILAEHDGMHIGLLKLDIEGAEKGIFDANDASLQAIPVVVVELHERIVAGCEASFKAFSANRTIVKLGYEKFLSLANA